ncbi:MAG: hypothetical protein ACD_28C00401G0006 [uncultured bacterium]|nr:MAG: hypothetical protein ACD_28C00401G0006 [uncultured bacterium]KKT75975.1 MAG: UvrD/REP helicase [Candidatus Peregrinibacteria bacterium GW2011_GWA2_44_7]
MMRMDDSVFQKRYSVLNEAQRRAVDLIEGPVLVVAGPGSGKTELLSLRVANILRLTDAPPSSILCLTFTEAAATNMHQRLLSLMGAEAHRVGIHTFHSFGSEIIQNYPEYFYSGALTHPADTLVQIEILSDILNDLKVDHPLKAYHPEQGYTYLKDILQRIDELKKAGLRPADFLSIVRENQEFLQKALPFIQDFFAERISKKMLLGLDHLLQNLESLVGPSPLTPLSYIPLSQTLIQSLRQAQKMALNENRTTPLTEWKKTHTQQNRSRQTVLRDAAGIEKHLALGSVYELYQQQLHQRGYFDFADMILQVVEALEQNPDLKYTLQEKYLYLLVDEFQDTNGVQLRLMEALADAEIHEGRPNILAVGDDDQAIYKFQGANLQNILTFHSRYRAPEMIVLTQNYRSTQSILDVVRPIVLQGSDRLETLFPQQITKVLEAASDSVEGEICEKLFVTASDEFEWIATQVQSRLDAGCSASEIAVIAPKHKILKELVPIFQARGIPFAYEQNQDLLEAPALKGLLIILEFIDSFHRHELPEADELLPSILSLPFWELSPVEIWQVSIEAYRKKRFWLEVMKEHAEAKIQNIALFLMEMGSLAHILTAEELLDRVIGSRPSQTPSPYKNYYFSEDRLHKDPAAYFYLLSTLEAFIQAVRKHKGSQLLTLKDLMIFVQLHRKHHVSLSRSIAFLPDEKAVALLSAHKAKGLEFDTVFVVHCTEESWVKGQHFHKLSFPSNLPLSPEADNLGDRLRLFYVAITRAKRHLYLTRAEQRNDSKLQLRLRFLEEVLPVPPIEPRRMEADRITLSDFSLGKSLSSLCVSPGSNERDFLLKRLENYQLSVTHFNTFLNVAFAGPKIFFENVVLKFPQRPSAKQSYGTALHLALHQFQSEFKRTEQLPSLEFLKERFQQSLVNQRLNEKDFTEYLEKGHDELSFYYQHRLSFFHVSDHPEFNFERQGVVIGGAALTGKIDRLHLDKVSREAVVYDYKTGKPLLSWHGYSDSEKIKAWEYRNQFLFYKLLIENAREFKSLYTVRQGVFEFLTPYDGQFQALSIEVDSLFLEKMSLLIPKVYGKIVNLDFPATDRYPKNTFGIEAFINDLISGTV